MPTRSGPAEEFGQDKEIGRLVETRIADPGGRWSNVVAVHEALTAQGVAVLLVEWGQPERGADDEVRVLADRAVTDMLTALPVTPDPREDLAEKIDAATTVPQLKALLRDEFLPRLRIVGERPRRERA
jgi:hypothetical protein